VYARVCISEQPVIANDGGAGTWYQGNIRYPERYSSVTGSKQQGSKTLYCKIPVIPLNVLTRFCFISLVAWEGVANQRAHL
jgi:hypothetical protein